MNKLGDNIVLDFTTHDPLTGNVHDADEIPTCEVFEGIDDTSMYTPTVEKRVSKDGNYRVQIDSSVENGFEVGKTYNVIVTAIVSSIVGKSRIGLLMFDSMRVSDVKSDTEAIKVKTDMIDWSDIDFIKAIEGGRWKIIANQMIFYDEDNITEVARFNLKNVQGTPSMPPDTIMERNRVL